VEWWDGPDNCIIPTARHPHPLTVITHRNSIDTARVLHEVTAGKHSEGTVCVCGACGVGMWKWGDVVSQARVCGVCVACLYMVRQTYHITRHNYHVLVRLKTVELHLVSHKIISKDSVLSAKKR
jgi:hypothetical protein